MTKITIPQRPLDPAHPDYGSIAKLCEKIKDASGGWERFAKQIPALLRAAIDEVIDTPRSGRFVLGQLEKTEKTYIGTKVEILVRDFLKVPKGLLLDLEVDGAAVDVKNTVSDPPSWMIPLEAQGHLCILLHEDEHRSACSVGVIVARSAYLTAGENRDKKVGISAKGKESIHWLLHDHPYPRNFWIDVSEPVRIHIMRPRGGTDRVARLLLENLERPVPMRIAEGVARQKDFRRRMRRGGGVRDVQGKLGVVLLNGTFDSRLVEHFGHAGLARDAYLAIPVQNQKALKYVRSQRHDYVSRTFDAEAVTKQRCTETP